MTAGRRQMPVTRVSRQPHFHDLVEYVNRNAGLFPQEPQGSGHAAPSELMLMHRKLWFDCGGIDELFRHWGWSDIDLVLRVTQQYPLVHLNNYGVNPIHMEHYTQARDYDPKTFHRKQNRPVDNPPFQANDEHWGLADQPLEWFRCENVAPVEEAPAVSPGTMERWSITIPQISADLVSQPVTGLVDATAKAFSGLIVESDINALLRPCVVQPGPQAGQLRRNRASLPAGGRSRDPGVSRCGDIRHRGLGPAPR